MTVLITADLHLSAQARDSYRHEFMRDVLPNVIEEFEVEHVVILGDLTEEKDRHSAWLVNTTVEHIDVLAQKCMVTFMRGNHDYLTPEFPFFKFITRLKNVQWINTPKEAILKFGAYEASCLFLPHTANYKRDWEGLDFSVHEFIFAHNTFSGAKGDNGHILEGIPTDLFPSDARVIAGDVHTPQRVGPITYVGAPYLVDFGNEYQPRVLIINEGVTSIKVGGRQKRLVEIESLDELEHQPDLNPGDILKVRVILDMSQHADWPEIKEEVVKWAAEHEYQLHLVQPKVERIQTAKTKKRVHAPKSDEELLEAYAQRRGVDNLTQKAGLNLLRKA